MANSPEKARSRRRSRDLLNFFFVGVCVFVRLEGKKGPDRTTYTASSLGKQYRLHVGLLQFEHPATEQ